MNLRHHVYARQFCLFPHIFHKCTIVWLQVVFVKRLATSIDPGHMCWFIQFRHTRVLISSCPLSYDPNNPEFNNGFWPNSKKNESILQIPWSKWYIICKRVKCSFPYQTPVRLARDQKAMTQLTRYTFQLFSEEGVAEEMGGDAVATTSGGDASCAEAQEMGLCLICYVTAV